ncbi:MAG: peptide chain release factor N(5)-glutamine methyltransferase [Ignavibacteria bacterium]|jgi:release factor glutamine methyltransferase|nr:peptide chain release factor N(5)-glutamine methyltransferase [Ignavibacteria bacterium]MCU7504037.1 peptide chain release factor N(5)-glutamine methyltransferase [Ignavibacteria bacterium]MCU7515409.1 peptide chain release factor N(5)-glutamine methyltransferase [Ignavibacteria bacterium]
MTVLEAIRLTTEFFEKKGIESPRINAELLLAHILKCKRLDLYLSFDKPLQENEILEYREYLKRRAQNEPLQYITGEVEFYGMPFKVNPSALIPRPETEILIEVVINSFDKQLVLSFLDIGTGTGNIPITLARHFLNSEFLTVDINEGALLLAEENAILNKIEGRIRFVKGDILSDEFRLEHGFDVIVSNPPYVSLDEYKSLQPEITKFEPMEALTDNADGLTFYRTISRRSSEILKKGGRLFFEVGQGQSDAVAQVMKDCGLKNIGVKKDYLNIERVIFGEKD